MKLRACALPLLFTLTAPAIAQEVIEIHGLPAGVVIGPGGEILMAGGTPQAAPAAAGAETPRLQKLKTLQFDRRPSAILKAWSTPPAPEAETEASSKAPDPASPEAPAPADPAATEPGASAEQAAGAPPSAPENAAGGAEPAAADAEPAAPTAEAAAAEQAAEAARKAEEAKRKAEEEARRQAEEAKALEREVAQLQRDVTLGAWDAVRGYFKSLPEAEAKAGFAQMLESLKNGPPPPQSPFAQYAEKNAFTPVDVLGIAAAAPAKLEEPQVKALGAILKQCIDAGNVLARVTALLREGLAREGFPLAQREVARVLFAAGYPLEAGAFLPDLEAAQAADDREALNLLARTYLARHAEEGDDEFLEKAWIATQAVLAAGKLEDAQKEEGLKRAVELAPRVREELGQAWLDESFTSRPDRGMEILATIGSAAAGGLLQQARDAEERLKTFELQTTAANALLDAAPERAGEWRGTLDLLASNWLREAQYSWQFDRSTSRGPRMQRDMYGNFFYYDWESQYRGNQNQPEALPTARVLEIRPSERWLALVNDTLRPRFDVVFAQLLLKVNDEDEAFPYIERVAAAAPPLAQDLVDEFVRVWTRNHNPNENSRRTNQYVYFFGFEERASAIPLTRSKQERNLTELAQWVARLRRLPAIELDEELLTEAFVAAHSSAEVYRLDNIEKVFGALEALEPRTLAGLVQRMRANLVSVWRDPAVQQEKKTQRRQKDLQAEVLRGYGVAQAVVEQALVRHPDHWALLLASASVLHDLNNYRQELEKSPEFSARRRQAFELFQRAAARYAAAVPELEEDERTAEPFDTWFYAALGACDLAAISHEHVAAEEQFPRIAEALRALPGEAAEKHLGMFASSLFSRMGSVNPAVKYRYVRSGLEIAGDHEAAWEAREVCDYYADLVTEIRLETAVDGSPRVGQRPFGLWVNLLHTREIEREAGGFAKYLTNQNSNPYAYNYGRPPEDYRDKFEEAARKALEERFEVLSVTFNHPKTNSRAVEEYGWRVTPYAYLLIKPRGPEVDRVPSLRLDLDFLDTSGYAVLPVESPPVSIDASVERAEPRPFRDLQVTQTLDERQARDGKLILEVKARANGLVPDLEQVVEVGSAGFEVANVDDLGVSVSEFDAESEETSIVSERVWTLRLAGEEGQERLPESFTFARPAVADTKVEYLRFVDADLENVGPVVALEARYGTEGGGGVKVALFSALGALLLGVLGWTVLRRRGSGTANPRFRAPDALTPFTVIGLLREIQANDGLSAHEHQALNAEIQRIERHYFQDDGSTAPDLRELTDAWLRRAR